MTYPGEPALRPGADGTLVTGDPAGRTTGYGNDIVQQTAVVTPRDLSQRQQHIRLVHH